MDYLSTFKSQRHKTIHTACQEYLLIINTIIVNINPHTCMLIFFYLMSFSEAMRSTTSNGKIIAYDAKERIGSCLYPIQRVRPRFHLKNLIKTMIFILKNFKNIHFLGVSDIFE